MLVREGLVDNGRLVGGHCRACGKPHFPELSTCPYCSSDDVELYRLQTSLKPQLREVAPGHLVACHLVERGG